MSNRGDFAVLCRSNANTLDRRRPMRRVVRYERTGKRDLDRTSSSLCCKGSKHRVGPQEKLTPNPAYEWRHQMDIVLVDTKCSRQIGSPPINHLAGRPNGQFIAMPRSDGRMGLHHGM